MATTAMPNSPHMLRQKHGTNFRLVGAPRNVTCGNKQYLLRTLLLRRFHVEMIILWILAPPTVSECNPTVGKTNPTSVTVCQTYVGADYK